MEDRRGSGAVGLRQEDAGHHRKGTRLGKGRGHGNPCLKQQQQQQQRREHHQQQQQQHQQQQQQQRREHHKQPQQHLGQLF